MNDEPKSIWKRPLVGWRKWLAWLALFAAVTVVIFCIGRASPGSTSTDDLLATSVLIAVVTSALALALVAFVRWLCCWRNFRRFLFGVACLVTLVLVAYAVENWRGHRAWVKHKRQWEAQGEKFTLAALMPPPVPDEQNFALAPLLKPALDFSRGPAGIVWRDTNALARLHHLRADLRPHGSTNDNLSLGNLDKGTFADLAACREFYRGNTNYPQPATPGTPAEDILVALGRFDPELSELRAAAATRPQARFPIQYDEEPPWGILLPHLAHLKGLCILTQVRAIAKMELGQSPAALEELKLGLRLSDAPRDEPLLFDHLVRVATLGINLQTVREGLVRHAWSDAQLAELEQRLASLDLLAEYKLAMRGERACCTVGLDYLRRQGFRTDPMDYLGSEDGGAARKNIGFNPFPSGWFYQNMLVVSRAHQDFLLAAVDERAHRVFPDVADKLDTTMAQMRTGPYTVFARLLLPALGKAVRKTARMQAYVDAARVACALERHRLATGQLPEALAALTPRYLPKIPSDIVDGQPLRYRRTPDGGCVLYSVGWNQTDDGGELGWTQGKKPTVDVAKGDWVWSCPAK